MKDLKNNLASKLGNAPAARTNGTFNGATLDSMGYEACVVEFISGTVTDGLHVCSLEDSSDGSAWAAVPADTVVGTAQFDTDAESDNTIKTLGYLGGKRFVRGVITTTGATTGAVLGINYILGLPRHAPTPANT